MHLWKSAFSDYVNPLRDWTIGLAAAALLFAGWSSYIAFDFYDQFIVPLEVENVATEGVLYKEKEVLFYATEYDEKEKIFEELRKDRTYLPPVVENVLEENTEAQSESEPAPLAGEPVAE